MKQITQDIYYYFMLAGKNQPEGYKGERNISYEDKHTVCRKKKENDVHYRSWFIAGSWKYSRKKIRENNYTCLCKRK